MHKKITSLLLAAMISFAAFAIFGHELEVFNGKVRTFLKRGEFTKFKFSDEGIPSQINARVGDYISPFYVVHFGMIYSETCRKPEYEGRFHWSEDPTAEFWPGEPEERSISSFRNSLDWLVNAVSYKVEGNAHFIYDFTWPYRGYPDGKLEAGWWSGLTDGYAIVLLLRGYDCFGDDKYLRLATDLYESVLTPIDEGGSLLNWGGLPWIEEYVDPTAPKSGLSRVWNGMAYAYFGVKSYEELTNEKNAAPALFESMKNHVREYDLGYWSYYDAIGTRANIKYHGVNAALIADPRLEGVAADELVRNWALGYRIPIFYLFKGPLSYALVHAWLTILAITALLYFIIKKIIIR